MQEEIQFDVYTFIARNKGQQPPTRFVQKQMSRNQYYTDFKDIKDMYIMDMSYCIRQWTWLENRFQFGIFANQNLPSDFPVDEYRGVMEKHPVGFEHPSAYLVETGLFTEDGLFTWSINSENFGSEARFMNHDDNPNCKIYMSMDNRKVRAFIYTTKPIMAGEQLFIDYGRSYWNF